MKTRILAAFAMLTLGLTALNTVANAAPGGIRTWDRELLAAADQAAESVRVQDMQRERAQTQQRLKDGSGSGQRHQYQHRNQYQTRQASPQFGQGSSGPQQSMGGRGRQGQGGGRR